MTSSQLVLIWITATLICCAIALYTAIKILSIRRLLHRKLTYLELTPAASAQTSGQASASLYTALHAVLSKRSYRDRILLKRNYISLEIVSTKNKGIRYIAVLEQASANSFKQIIHAYQPTIQITETQDPYVDHVLGAVGLVAQSSHYALPLSIEDVAINDPFSYLTGSMTKLTGTDAIGIQLVLSPVVRKDARRLSKEILINEDILQKLRRFGPVKLHGIGSIVTAVLLSMSSVLSELLQAPGQRPVKDTFPGTMTKRPPVDTTKPARTITRFEQQLLQSVQQKLDQKHFTVDIRIIISESLPKERLLSVAAGFSHYSLEGYQQLKLHRRTLVPIRRKLLKQSAARRLPSILMPGNILSAQEIAALYHFENDARVEDLVKTHSRLLPAPLSLKSDANFDIILGSNTYHGTTTLLGLTSAERERHVYIIGGTGNGKTTMLQYGIVQDMQNGKGVAVLDPHGDMAETLLKYVPVDRIKDVVYFNPDDLLHPIGLNILELTPGLTGAELLREKDLVTESVISLFRKIFSDEDSGGHRVEYVLRNTIQTALTLEDSTLFTIFDLLNDSKFRRSVVKGLENKDLKNFWLQELGKAGDFQRVKMAAGITAKVGRFLFSASAKQILEQPKSTINFDELIDSGKILICNLSKGLLGEDTSELFGITILTKLQLASLHRARVANEVRRPFYIYVDEFQNFATTSFVQMLSESRKYKMYMVMAEQSTSQQKEQRTVNIILANVGTVICFRSGNPADEQAVLPLFSSYIEQGEIASLPSFNFYMRIAALQAQEPMSGNTLLLDADSCSDRSDQVIYNSREQYAKNVSETAKNEKIDTTANESTSNNSRTKSSRRPNRKGVIV